MADFFNRNTNQDILNTPEYEEYLYNTPQIGASNYKFGKPTTREENEVDVLNNLRMKRNKQINNNFFDLASKAVSPASMITDIAGSDPESMISELAEYIGPFEAANIAKGFAVGAIGIKDIVKTLVDAKNFVANKVFKKQPIKNAFNSGEHITNVVKPKADMNAVVVDDTPKIVDENQPLNPFIPRVKAPVVRMPEPKLVVKEPHNPYRMTEEEDAIQINPFVPSEQKIINGRLDEWNKLMDEWTNKAKQNKLYRLEDERDQKAYWSLNPYKGTKKKVANKIADRKQKELEKNLEIQKIIDETRASDEYIDNMFINPYKPRGK
jgi:hypothetical protein